MQVENQVLHVFLIHSVVTKVKFKTKLSISMKITTVKNNPEKSKEFRLKKCIPHATMRLLLDSKD